MDYRYTELDPRLIGLKSLLAKLQAIFDHLLLQTDGDVEEALRWLERVGKRYGLFSAEFTIDDFRKYLEQQKLVRRDPRGRLGLTHKGEHRSGCRSRSRKLTRLMPRSEENMI